MQCNDICRRIATRFEFLCGTLKAIVFGVNISNKARISWGAKVIRMPGGSIALGSHSRVHHGAILSTDLDGYISIGDNSSVNPYCAIYGQGGVSIGDRVRIASHTVIVAANHDFVVKPDGGVIDRGLTKKGITIGNDVWLGSGCKILDGVNICSGVVIGAGSVVNKDINKSGIYAGVPATFKKELLIDNQKLHIE